MDEEDQGDPTHAARDPRQHAEEDQRPHLRHDQDAAVGRGSLARLYGGVCGHPPSVARWAVRPPGAAQSRVEARQPGARQLGFLLLAAALGRVGLVALGRGGQHPGEDGGGDADPDPDQITVV